MRSAKRCALLVAVVCSAAGGVARAALVTPGYGSNLLRRTYTLQNNESITVETYGCGPTDSDTMLFLFEGTGATRITRGFNDDTGNSGDEFCSYITFNNYSGSPRTYEVVATIYPNSQYASVTYAVWRSSTGTWTTESVTLTGITRRLGASSAINTYETVGVRPPNGSSIDTVLYAINTNLGADSYFDDDSGMAALSQTSPWMPCNGINCWVVAGDYYFGGSPTSFEVWVTNGDDTDSDGDGIADGIESAKGTSPSSADSDGDGLSDFEEFKGVAAANLSGIDNSLVMPWQGYTGANPLTQDLFVQVDYMTGNVDGTQHTHDPRAAGNWTTYASDLVATFQNDAAFTGRTIVPHVIVSNSLTESNSVSFGHCGFGSSIVTNFYDIKTNPAYFDPLRAGIFHYMIIGHTIMDPTCSTAGNWSGQAEIWGNDIILAMGVGGALAPPNVQHGTFDHELGHNLALSHWGNGNPGTPGPNSWVHSSVMNYRYQFGGWGNSTIPSARRWGYSNGMCPTVGHGSGNTCNASKCVPSNESSPKTGCSSNNGACDCDRGEWQIANLDIPGYALMSYEECQAAQCSGASDGLASTYFLGDSNRYAAVHRRYAAKRRQKLEAAGLREGRDFVVHPQSGRLYSSE